MKAYVFLGCPGIERDKAGIGIQAAAGFVRVLELMGAFRAHHDRSFSHPAEVVLSIRCLAVLRPTNISPQIGLLRPAMGATELPFSLVGSLVFAVGIVSLKAALAQEDALTQPAECRHTRLSLRHVTNRPAPSLVSNQPPDRAALQIALVVGTGHPEGHAIGKMDGGISLLVAV